MTASIKPAPGLSGPAKTHEEEGLDDALDDSFPASDPPSMTDPSRHTGKTPGGGQPARPAQGTPRK